MVAPIGAIRRHGGSGVEEDSMTNRAILACSVLDKATGDEVTRIGFETGVHGVAAADGSVWVLDLHGPGAGEDLEGTTIWRFDPATVTP
jgi:hypothetical protein